MTFISGRYGTILTSVCTSTGWHKAIVVTDVGMNARLGRRREGGRSVSPSFRVELLVLSVGEGSTGSAR